MFKSGTLWIGMILFALFANGPTWADCSGKSPLTPGNYRRGILVEGGTRTYILHIPPGYKPTHKTPLIFMFHGGWGQGENFERNTDMDAVADRHGFVVVYPDGIRRSWNGGGCCGPAMKENVDDIGFVNAMIDRFSADLCIDPRRIYATGLSNGAVLSHRLACELSNRIAAVAPVAGTIRMQTCAPKRPVPILIVHGTADERVPYNGGVGLNPRSGSWPSVKETVADWLSRNHSSQSGQVIYQKGSTQCVVYRGYGHGADVELCTVEGEHHGWPGSTRRTADGYLPVQDFNADEAIWSFFATHPMAENPPPPGTPPKAIDPGKLENEKSGRGMLQ